MKKGKGLNFFYNILLPSGDVTRMFDYDDTDRNEAIMKYVLNHWIKYIEGNWLNYKDGDHYCPEQKIKRMMEGCALYLLRGNSEGANVLSDYKTKRVSNTEIPVSSCDTNFLEMLSSGDYVIKHGYIKDAWNEGDKYTPPVALRPKTTKTKFDLMREVFADGKVVSCRVNTENEFDFMGNRFRISSRLEQYSPK